MVFIKNDVFKKIFKLIKSYDEIVIARHIGPDPDAVASSLALRDSIKLTFPNKKVYAVGAGVSKFKYLGHHDKVDFNSITNALLIVLDVPNFHRVDGIEGLTFSSIIKIDHHPEEDIVGTVDFTSSKYSSAAEMIADVLYNTHLKMNKQIAEKLFLGIVSDSERFLFNNTQISTFETAVKLIKDYKLDFSKLYYPLYEKDLNEIKFEAYITNNLNITKNGLASIVIDSSTLKEYSADSSTAATIINNYNFIKEILVWTFITYDERNEIFKVNIRSRGPVINKIASKYNGGGHPFASGARIVEKENIKNFLDDLEEACKEYNENKKD